MGKKTEFGKPEISKHAKELMREYGVSEKAKELLRGLHYLDWRWMGALMKGVYEAKDGEVWKKYGKEIMDSIEKALYNEGAREARKYLAEHNLKPEELDSLEKVTEAMKEISGVAAWEIAGHTPAPFGESEWGFRGYDGPNRFQGSVIRCPEMECWVESWGATAPPASECKVLPCRILAYAQHIGVLETLTNGRVTMTQYVKYNVPKGLSDGVPCRNVWEIRGETKTK